MPTATRFRLSNGLDVILQESHRQPQVAVLMAYDVGHRDDPPGYQQLAHLVEHMTYRGSKHLGPLQGWEILRRSGAQHQQGTTTLDQTHFASIVPSQALATALWVESERMAFSLERFDQRNLDVERKTVESELRLSNGPDALFYKHLRAAMFGVGHPYARAGHSPDDLANITLSDVQWFFQRGYRPERAHLVIAGDFDTATAKTLVEKYFGPIVGPPRPSARVGIERHTQFASGSLVYEVPELYREKLALVWPAPPRFSREGMALQVFSHIFATRLRERLVRRDGVAVNVSTGWTSLDAAAQMEIEIVLSKGAHQQRVEEAIKDEWVATWNRDWTVAFREATQRAVLATLAALEEPLRQATMQLAFVAARGVPLDWASVLAEYRSLTSADIAVLQSYLRNHRWLVGRMLRGDPRDPPPPLGRVTIN